MLLMLQLVETVTKHDISIRQESARHYTTCITQHFIAKHMFYFFGWPLSQMSFCGT